MTRLVVGLHCALPNDELCIHHCHFEKCNYLSDKADGGVLSGICCASIRCVVLKTQLQVASAQMWVQRHSLRISWASWKHAAVRACVNISLPAFVERKVCFQRKLPFNYGYKHVLLKGLLQNSICALRAVALWLAEKVHSEFFWVCFGFQRMLRFPALGMVPSDVRQKKKRRCNFKINSYNWSRDSGRNNTYQL